MPHRRVIRHVRGFRPSRMFHPDARVEVPVRVSLVSLALVGILSLIGWATWRAVSVYQPNAAWKVAPGNMPVASPVWVDDEGQQRVVVPKQSVGQFPYGTPRPGFGSDEFVQVLHFQPRATRREHAARIAAGSEPRSLRFTVEVRPVSTQPFSPGYLQVVGVRPNELMSARYVYSVGDEDLVSAQAPPLRRIDYPARPPLYPVFVEYARGSKAFRVSVIAPRSGWSAKAFPLGSNSAPIELRSEGRPGRLLKGRIPDNLLGAEGQLLDYDLRPQLNIGWLVVRDERDQVVVRSALRF